MIPSPAVTVDTPTITPPSERKLRNHVSIRQSFANSFTMAYRGVLKIKRTPEQLFDVTLQPIIFTVMFAYLFGGAIAGDVQNYLPALIPGILVQTVITTSVVTGVQLREDMEKGVFNRRLELIALAHGFYEDLGLTRVSLLLNSMGDEQSRPAYVTRLREYLLDHEHDTFIPAQFRTVFTDD